LSFREIKVLEMRRVRVNGWWLQIRAEGGRERRMDEMAYKIAKERGIFSSRGIVKRDSRDAWGG
jgi:hypothetical protein